ncbi:MFS transporter [Streptomyces sp. SM8]|uniref:MFS transporter n=1 Tax=Streptomyces sp. SM8 TaxID=1195457 RepID=UPI000C2A4723|nr:MFS transporter [Streptomyces sp. SM8]PKA35036.1 MFS transporter [Streptomyces sp. SM8]
MRRAARVVGRALRTPVTGPARGIHGVNGAGDVMITVALASTVFFSVPTDEARGRVALYLAVTMLPFTLLAPVVGPLLDRLPHGRRAAMAGSMLARAVLALVLSGAVATGSLEMYPAALGVLVASKAYGVVRSAVVPRLLPQGFSLVKANSRVTLGGLLATGVAAPVGAGLQMIGPGWPLYGACLLFLGGAFLSFRLPPKVDSARGERRALLAADEQHLAAAVDARWDPVATDDKTDDKTDSTDNKEEEKDRDGERGDGERGKGKERRRKGPGLRTVGPAVTHALAANACVRCQSGFLIFFLAFLLREHPLTGQSAAVSLAVVGVAAGAGNALGTAVGAWLRARAPEVIIVTVVGALVAVAVSAAVFFGAAVVAVLGAVAGFTQALAKLSLDALIQRDVPELVRTSAFARSETLLQMAWVVGGAIGIALPLRGPLGLSVGALIVALGWLTTVRALLASARRGASHPRVA